MRNSWNRNGLEIRLALTLATIALVGATSRAQSPGQLPDVQKEGQLTTKPTVRTDPDMKLPPPTYDPAKEMPADNKPSRYRYPSRLKLGIYSADSNNLRRATHPIYYAFGASVDLPPTGLTQPLTPEAYVDGAYHHDYSSDTEATLIGVGLGFRLYPGAKPGFSTIHRSRPYVGAGLGVYYLETDLGGVQNQKTTGGGKLTAGFDLPNNWSFEVNYTATGKVNGFNMSGSMATFAYRL